ncbi:MAG: ABC transporter permease, partial [Anaerolineales bacterium]
MDLVREERTKVEVKPVRSVLGRWRWALLPLTTLAGITVWWAIADLSGLPTFILPAPDRVWMRFVSVLVDGTLLRHAAVTMTEVLMGLGVGVLSATLLGYILAKSRNLERLLSPYIVASQSIPVVAIAPLLVIWLGPGEMSKVVVAALIVFFPVLVNTVVGVRSVPEDLYELMRSLRATRWQVFSKLEVPAA